MPTPPLWLSTQDLSNTVHMMAETAGLNFDERKALLVLLGIVIGTGETSHVRCLQRIDDVIQKDRSRIVEAVAEIESAAGPRRYGVSGPNPDSRQQGLRWDQE